MALLPTRRGFPVPGGDQCLDAAFVPVYRCGAVPDLNRIPSFDGSPIRAAVPISQLNYIIQAGNKRAFKLSNPTCSRQER